MKMDHSQQDEALNEMFNKRGNVREFLNKIFGFVKENTNFFNSPDISKDMRTEFVLGIVRKYHIPALDENGVETEVETFAPANYRNGAVHDNYCWNQNLEYVELLVKLPPDVQNVDLEILSDSITLKNRDDARVIFSGDLLREINETHALWTIDDKGRFVITLDKEERVMWEKLLISEDPVYFSDEEVER